MIASIVSIENNVITYDVPLSIFDNGIVEIQADYIEPDDYALYVPEQASIGEVTVKLNAVALGNGSIAAGNEAYASGRASLAYGDYAYVEGYGSRAAYAAHAEGVRTIAESQCHSEGYET